MVLNVVMVGFFGAVTRLVDPEALRKAVADSVPAAMQQLNLQAFDAGFEHGLTILRSGYRNGESDQALVSLEQEA